MDHYGLLVLARVVHVLGVLFWIGGVAFVTTVLIPSIRQRGNTEQRLELFEQLEGRFGFQAKIATLLTLLSGLYMLAEMDLWHRYLQLEYWWLHLMTLVWLIFTLMLFVLEPLFLHRWFREQAMKNSGQLFFRLQVMHQLLLIISLMAIAGALAGAHGYP
jgi:uncharacterized membrane protein